jgi:HAD superfamily hydrolase (TIGR01549 family)
MRIDTEQIKLVVFDCDGVMFDSREANETYYNDVLARFGMPPMNREESDYAHMHTADESVAYLFREDHRLEEALAFRREMSYMPFIPMMRMEPYLKDFLNYLRPAYKTAISTNRSDTMERVLVEHGLEGAFDLVVSSLDVQNPKPHPESLLKILQHFRLSPWESIYIGDSEIDEVAAREADIPLVAYKNKKLSSAVCHVENFKEIEILLEGKDGQDP